jgi:hypothetical protein
LNLKVNQFWSPKPEEKNRPLETTTWGVETPFRLFTHSRHFEEAQKYEREGKWTAIPVMTGLCDDGKARHCRHRAMDLVF